MIIQCSKSVGNIKSMMVGMDVFVQKLVLVEESMQEILMCVENEPNFQPKRC